MSFASATLRLPWASPDDLLHERGLVVVAPHPDDETLGCGGLLAGASRADRLRHVVFLTDGERSHPGTGEDLAAIRRTEAMVATAYLGLAPSQLSFLGLPDSGLATLQEEDRAWAMQWLRCLAVERSPCIVVVTSDTDQHSDHRAAFTLVAEAIKSLPGVELMAYPVWSWLLLDGPGPLAGVRIDVSGYRKEKDAAIRAYASQLGERVRDVEGFRIPGQLLGHVTGGTEVLLHVQL